MKLDEAVAAARRIGPIRCVDIDGVPVEAFGGVTKEVSVNGADFVAAAGTLVVIGGGYVYYQGTAGDASVLGFIAIKLTGDCQEVTVREEVEALPQGIPAGTDEADYLHVGPLHALDDDGVAVLAETFAGAGELEVSINGAAWAAPASAAVELSEGYYDYPPDQTEVTAIGWLAVKITGPCQEFVFRVDIVDPANLTGSAEDSPPTAPTLPEADAVGIGHVAGDLALVWSTELVGDADLYVLDTDIDEDLATDRGLVTAALLSLFTDRRAETDDKPPSGDATDRRGWWGDQFAVVQGDRYGSRLWLLDRSKLNNETVLRAREYVREGLAWMLEDRVVSRVDVTVEARDKALLFAVGLQRPGKDPVTFRFAHAWDHLQEAG